MQETTPEDIPLKDLNPRTSIVRETNCHHHPAAFMAPVVGPSCPIR